MEKKMAKMSCQCQEREKNCQIEEKVQSNNMLLLIKNNIRINKN